MNENEHETPKEKLPFDDPRYQIPGIPNAFNLSKWTRENTPQEDFAFAERDIVVLTVVAEVLTTTRDVDGTPLYRLSVPSGWWSQSSVRAATDDEKNNY